MTALAGLPAYSAASAGTKLTHRPSSFSGPLSAEDAVAVAGMLKALSDPVRLRLFSLIASSPEGEICVCDLAEEFDLTQPTISHHLRKLRESGLVDQERRGTWVFYSVPPAALIELSVLLTSCQTLPSRRDDAHAAAFARDL
jgi:ArsR family transcriptional regulator, arsenate/arsenite/antimonite-responsive transcriptional repressor